MKTQWITHKEKRILLVDCSNYVFQAPQIKLELDVAVQLATKEPLNSVLVLSDVRGSKMSLETFKMAKDASSQIAPFAYKRAMVGVANEQEILLDALNALFPKKKIVPFRTIEEAKDWLVS
jgi:hypothetical protein